MNELAASRCTRCAHMSCPPQRYCPEGCGATMEHTTCRSSGVLYATTVVHIPHPEFGDSYQVGYADLDDGPRVFGHLPDTTLINPGARINAEMHIDEDDEKGRRVRTQFRPVATQEVGT